MANATLKFDLHPKQLLAYTSQANEILYGGAAGGGKLLPLTELLPTPSGWIVMGDVRVGQELFDENGEVCRVTAVSAVEQEPDLWEFVFDDGSKIVSCVDHQWVTSMWLERKAVMVSGVRTTREIISSIDDDHVIVCPGGFTWGNSRDRRWRHITSALPVPSAPGRCIQVDSPSHMYLAGEHFIPTHNSHLMRVAAITSSLEVPGLQTYLFRRLSTDLEKNHIEGPSGLPILLAPLVKSDVVKITYSPKVEVCFKNGPYGGYEGGSKIFLCHCKDEKDKYSHQGEEIHQLLMDELVHFTETIYTFLRSRVRMVGLSVPPGIPAWRYPRILCGANPGGIGHGWVKSMFIDGADPLEIRHMDEEDGGMRRQYIPAKLTDNPSLMQADPKYAARLKGLGNDSLVRAMLDGDWDVFVGQAFDFSQRYHVIDPLPVPAGAQVYMTLDWGYGAPFAIGWYWVDADGRIYMFDEWYGWNGKPNVGLRIPDTDIAKGILERERAMGIAGRHIERLAGHDCFSKKPDYNGGGQGPSTADVFAQHGIYLRKADPEKAKKLRQFYERLRVPEDGTPPMFQVYSTCKQTIRTIPTLTMKDDRPDELEDHRAEDHWFDSIGQLFSSRPITMDLGDEPKTETARLLDRLVQPQMQEGDEVAGAYFGEAEEEYSEECDW